MIVKAHVARMSGTGAKAAALHLRYIERDGVEKDGSKGRFYTAEGPAQLETLDEPRRGERHQFRLIVSPEDAGELDLTDYVRRLMAEVERDVGRKLEWAAVNHFDTAHPHAHLVIRGVDREGREVRLDRGYISQGLRWRAQELATEELGPRLAVDIERAHAKEIGQERFTSLDREIELRANDNRVEGRSGARAGRIDESTLLARLRHLEALRLAERHGPVSWTLAPGWQDVLRDLGTRGDILKQIHKALPGDPVRYRIVRPGQALDADGPSDGKVRVGRVASKGLSDELKGAFYAVIEAPTGHAYHVTLDARAAEAIRPGDVVSFATKPEPPVRPVDRQIAEVAGAQGGVYAAERTAGAVSAAHERRLRELERLGLTKPEAPGRWKVPPNLLELLAERHRETPVRHRLFLRKEPLSVQAQVRHPGPVWIDRVEAASLAPTGFGGELRHAVEQRREAVRGFGLEPDDPARASGLRDLERRAVGREIALRSGQAFVSETPGAFRGRLQAAGTSFPGSGYVVVSDGSRLVVLGASSSLRAAQGKTVMLTRDGVGRMVLRAIVEKDMDRSR